MLSLHYKKGLYAENLSSKHHRLHTSHPCRLVQLQLVNSLLLSLPHYRSQLNQSTKDRSLHWQGDVWILHNDCRFGHTGIQFLSLSAQL
ncbi:unnamed protein product [Calypogeia fissa]